MEEKIKWKTIKIPQYLYDKLKSMTNKTHPHMYQVIEKALEHYEIYLKKPKKKSELPRLDKAAWYIVKLVTGVTCF